MDKKDEKRRKALESIDEQRGFRKAGVYKDKEHAMTDGASNNLAEARMQAQELGKKIHKEGFKE